MAWEILEQVALILVWAATGGALVYGINWLKSQFELSGKPALILSGVVAVFVAAAFAVVEGNLRPDFDVKDFASTAIAIFVSAQVWYRQIK